MHEVIDERIAQLSAAMNCDSLIAFQKKYPGVRSEDISALIERSRTAQRQSIMRQPTIKGYEHHRELFGDDPKLKQSIRNYSFKMALGVAADPEPLKEYLKLFPGEEREVWAAFEDSLYTRWSIQHTQTSAATYLRTYPNGRYVALISEAGQAQPGGR
jgi:hypothetical protein